MTKPAFLVEGDLEQKFVQCTCPGAPVQKINCNGDQTSLDAVAKRVGSLARLLHKRHSPIVVVFDREGRNDDSRTIEIAFTKLLLNEGIQVPVVVGVPDRDIESWILADFSQFVASAKASAPTSNPIFEGKCGKKAIRGLLPHNVPYIETIDGVAWLKAARPQEMQRYSSSFKRFSDSLAQLDCWWLKEMHLDLKSR